MKNKQKNRFAVITAIVLCLVLSFHLVGTAQVLAAETVAPQEPADEPRPPAKTPAKGVTRIAGSDGYDTSLKTANALKKELGVSKFKTIVLASGKNFPDALTASSFVERKLGPVLREPGGSANNVVNYVKNNLAKNGTIYIVGGTNAVSKKVENSVKAFGNVIRLSGGTRYDTNRAILKAMKLKKGSNIMICSGRSFQDALSSSATGRPIMIVDKALGKAQLKLLSEILTAQSRVYIIGGTVAVPSKVESQLKKYTSNIKRIQGKNSYETAAAVARNFYPNAKQAVVATTKSFRDGLSGSVLAYVKSAPLLLTIRDGRFETTYKYITGKNLNSVTILGGQAAVDLDSVGLTKDGTKKKGFITVGGQKYFSNDKYVIQKDKIVTSNGKKYYMNSKGVLVKGTTINKDGSTWIAGKDGSLSKPSKVIYLTFDDGPGPYTSRLIDTLNRYGAKATFFVNGYNSTYRYCIGKASRSGHAIGNHTYSHDYSYVYDSTSNFWADVERLNNVIKDQTGKTTKLLRFPGGSSNMVSRNYTYGIMSTLTRQAGNRGWAYFDWNVDSNDAGGTTTSSGVYRNIVNGVSGRSSAVVLCHDIKGYTVDAIEDVIIWGQRNGYVFLALDTGSPTAHHSVNN